MTMLDTLVDGIITREGDYVDNPNDKGGKTRWGITEAVARHEGYAGDMRQLPREFAAKVYYAKYIRGPGFDKVAELSPIIAFELADTYVNMGAGNVAAKDGPVFWLQQWLNIFNRQGVDYADTGVDGSIGDGTLSVLKSFLWRRGPEGAQTLAKALNCSQGHRYKGLCEARLANEEFAFGWIKNRVELPVTPTNPIRPTALKPATLMASSVGLIEAEPYTGNIQAPTEKPTFATWAVTYLKLRVGEKSTLAGAAMLVAGLASNADFFASARSVYDAVHTGQGLAAVTTAAVSLVLMVYKSKNAPSVAEHLASQ